MITFKWTLGKLPFEGDFFMECDRLSGVCLKKRYKDR